MAATDLDVGSRRSVGSGRAESGCHRSPLCEDSWSSQDIERAVRHPSTSKGEPAGTVMCAQVADSVDRKNGCNVRVLVN